MELGKAAVGGLCPGFSRAAVSGGLLLGLVGGGGGGSLKGLT
jgi:hypothetical protein